MFGVIQGMNASNGLNSTQKEKKKEKRFFVQKHCILVTNRNLNLCRVNTNVDPSNSYEFWGFLITDKVTTVTGNFLIGLESNQAYIDLELSYSLQKYFCSLSLWARSENIGSIFAEVVHGLVLLQAANSFV